MGNDADKFEFEFSESANQFTDEFGEETVAFEGREDELEDKSEVIILTRSYRIRGKIALVPGARLTDYIIGSHQFIAVTEVEVRDRAGKSILKTPFLDVNRDQIELILPAELAKFEDTNS